MFVDTGNKFQIKWREFERNTVYRQRRREAQKGVVGVQWGRALRELVAFWGVALSFPTGRKEHKTVANVIGCGIIELSV